MVTFSLDDFTYNILKNDIARKEHFEVVIAVPQQVIDKISIIEQEDPGFFGTLFNKTGSPSDLKRTLSLMCQTFTMAGKNIDVVDDKTIGVDRKVPFGKSAAEIEIGFLATGNMFEKKLLDAWTDMIVDPKTKRLQFYDDYTTTITVNMYNKYGEIAHTEYYTEVFPTVQNSFELDQAGGDAVSFVNCSMSFRHKLSEAEYRKKKQNPDTNLISDPGNVFSTFDIDNIDNIKTIVNRAVDIYKTVTDQGDFTPEVTTIIRDVGKVLENGVGLSVKDINNVIRVVKRGTSTNGRISSSEKRTVQTILDNIITQIGNI